MNKREMLKEFILARGIVVEETILSSGKKSPYYYDIKQAILTPEALDLAGDLGLESIKSFSAKSVGGLESGSIPFSTAIALKSKGTGSPVQPFFVRKKARTHGRGKWIEGNLLPPAVIVDDVITTGASALDAANKINEETGQLVAAIVAVVDREEGAKELFASKGIPFRSIFTHTKDFKSFIEKGLASKKAEASQTT